MDSLPVNCCVSVQDVDEDVLPATFPLCIQLRMRGCPVLHARCGMACSLPEGMLVGADVGPIWVWVRVRAWVCMRVEC